ncbi:MAG: hypothetical protein KAT70_00565, partial [Thermoplasmata archaeon]|nr:hypothetical protein [Thermoplasmata archaeon]
MKARTLAIAMLGIAAVMILLTVAADDAKAEQPVIETLIVSDVSQAGFDVYWATENTCTGSVFWSNSTSGIFTEVAHQPAGNNILHEVQIDDTTPAPLDVVNTSFHFYIRSGGIDYYDADNS